MKKLIAIAILATLVGACTKGYTPDREPDTVQEVEVCFNSKANFSVTYTRAGEQTYNGVIGAVNAKGAWEFTPEEVGFDGLVGNATTPQTIVTSPETVVVPTGNYTFVSCAVSGNGKVTPDGESIAVAGGEQTANNDVVWCTKSATVVAQKGQPFGVELGYEHVFSAVRFELEAEGRNADALMAETTLSGVENLQLATNGVLNIKDGTISTPQNILGADESIDWKTNYLVVPAQSQSGLLTVNYRGVEYKGTLPARAFDKGERVVVSITLNTSSLSFSASVKSWEVVEDRVTLE